MWFIKYVGSNVKYVSYDMSCFYEYMCWFHEGCMYVYYVAFRL